MTETVYDGISVSLDFVSIISILSSFYPCSSVVKEKNVLSIVDKKINLKRRA